MTFVKDSSPGTLQSGVTPCGADASGNVEVVVVEPEFRG